MTATILPCISGLILRFTRWFVKCSDLHCLVAPALRTLRRCSGPRGICRKCRFGSCHMPRWGMRRCGRPLVGLHNRLPQLLEEVTCTSLPDKPAGWVVRIAQVRFNLLQMSQGTDQVFRQSRCNFTEGAVAISEPSLVGMQEHAWAPHLVCICNLHIVVLVVCNQWIPNVAHMYPDLMGAASDDQNLAKGEAFVRAAQAVPPFDCVDCLGPIALA
mmetsp:Transcript_44663/g.105953  ORF Transcript_44663/g.105953 Transcript_44663/m.105953 type:complete len:215 (-) Transcript_44663:265-909(-)